MPAGFVGFRYVESVAFSERVPLASQHGTLNVVVHESGIRQTAIVVPDALGRVKNLPPAP